MLSFSATGAVAGFERRISYEHVKIEWMKSIKEADVSGKRVVVRCDFDVPIKNGEVVDASRIKNTVPTLDYLLNSNASLLLVAHMGRPRGQDEDLSLKPVKSILEKLLGVRVAFQEDLDINKEAKVNLLENIRFWPQEERNDEEFAREIAALGETYVNECFASSHRAHTSIAGIPKYLNSYAGLNLIKEITELRKIFDRPSRPLVAVIGGAKIETKLPAIYNLAKVADKVLVGGKLMFEVERRALPENVVVANDDLDTKDIGEYSVKLFSELIKQAKMVVWNGPMGVFEDDRYMGGTKAIAISVVESNSYSVVGGGDTITALNKLGLGEKINFVSTGGGAMLEFLAGKKLPGLEALEEFNL